MRALVVFHGHGEGFLSSFLKPGFKHVFLCIDDGQYWIRLDARAGLPVVEVVSGSDFDLASHYEAQGMTVVEAEQAAQAPQRLVLPANCVGMVSGLLGLSGRVVTPFGLYRHLRSNA